MEPDRFKTNNKLYIIGILCLVTALTLIFFSLYIIPYLLWELNYNIPGFFLSLISIFHDDYDYSVGTSKFISWLIFFIPGLITGFISYYISNSIDNKIYSDVINENETEEDENQAEQKQYEARKDLRDSASLSLKIVFLIIVVIAVVFMINLIIK